MAAIRPLLLSVLALAAVSAQDLLDHIKTLASDNYEGRAPGSAGEARTVAYVQRQFRKLGLKPGNPNGSWCSWCSRCRCSA